MNIRTIILSAVAALGIISCGSQNQESAIKDSKFYVVELNGTEYVSQTEETAYILFEEGICSATVGGNMINAQYQEGKDGALTLSNSLSTKMLVPDEFREDEFVAAVNSIASYKADGNVVCFLDADGNVLIKTNKAE